MILQSIDSSAWHAADAAASAASAPMQKAEARTDILPRLLLVDDEPRLLASLCALLEDRGYELATASSGSEAIAQLATAQFDLMLLDLRLPDVGGHEIMDFMIAQKIDTAVIVLSGNTEIDAAIGALNREAYGYLRKPYPPEDLLDAVSKALRRRNAEIQYRKQAQQLRKSEKLYRYLVDSSPDIIYTVDTDGRFTFVNERMAQLLGSSRDAIIGNHYSELVHADDLDRARFAFIERRAGDRASRNVEVRLKSRVAGQRLEEPVRPAAIISVSSLGMYSQEQDLNKRRFVGTYGVARDISERKQAEALISYQAYHDILTDLPNRILFTDRLELALIQARRKKSELAVMFVDLDRFKEVNDTLGHIKGDELLRQVASRLKGTVRKGDTLARLGGDEFVLLLPDLRERADAAGIAEKFLECLQAPFELEGHEASISASIGIAVFPGDGETLEELIRHADIAMYQVKARGKNGHSFFEKSMLQASSRKLAQERDLRQAIERDELQMYYQPQIDVATGCIVGVEAMPVWHHPEQGMLAAGDFLPFAEQNGLIVPLTDWMLLAICGDLAACGDKSGISMPVSFNLSPKCLDQGDFLRKFNGALQHFGIPARAFELEITENVGILNQPHVIEKLNALCRLGVRIAIDDFGIGYASLAYLHRFPVHTIKIHRSFVKDIGMEDGHYPAVLAIISMARGLGLKLVAEGVDTRSQSAYLQTTGCTTMQGGLFHEAMPYPALMRRLDGSESAKQ